MNRKEYEERIAKLEKELKELKEAEITNDEFPQYDEIYWFTDTDGDVVRSYWSDDTDDNYRKDFLRIFKTEEECYRYSEIKETFMEESKEFEPDWSDHKQMKYFPYYNNCTKHLEVDCVNTHQGSTLYFKSSEVLEELIARFGEEDIKKYYFGIDG